MLFEESGIDTGVAAERGYRTARARSEVPEAFADYQRRLGLVVPMFSPDGTGSSYQLRPDRPRNPKLKYETPAGSEVLVDVHPRMIEEVRTGSGDLWITEGAKKGDALTSRGLPALSLAGVWMWCVPKVRPYRLKPCFDHVRLTGRKVYVVFDSDAVVKSEVQEALAALVGALEARGAEVLVCYLPDASNGSGAKCGVDDYLAGGRTVSELRMLARTFSPADVGRIRLSRDERLRSAVEDLRRRWWREKWKGRGGHSDRDVALELIEAAVKGGTIHADGIRVAVSWGVLQVGAKVARKTLAKALDRLEERGFLYRDNAGRRADRTGAFVLRAKVDQYRGTSTQATPELRACDPGGLPLRASEVPEVPRLHWPRPKFTPRRGIVHGTRKVRESKPPASRDRIERLGKIRGAVVDTLYAVGGSCTLQELCEVLQRTRPRDVKRRILPMLEEAGIIGLDGDAITLTPDWSERLNEARNTAGEVEADELAEEDRKRKSRAYRDRDKAPVSRPTAAGLEAVDRSHEKRAEHIAEHDEHQVKVRVAELEHRRFVKRFVHDRLRALGRIRLELLQEVLREEGGTPSYALPAAKSLGCTVERLPEYGNREFVFAPLEWVA